MSRILWFVLGGLTTAVGLGVVAIVLDDSGSTGTGEVDEASDLDETLGTCEILDVDEAATGEAKQPETSTEEGVAAESTDLRAESSGSSMNSQLADTSGQGGTTDPDTTETTENTGEKNND